MSWQSVKRVPSSSRNPDSRALSHASRTASPSRPVEAAPQHLLDLCGQGVVDGGGVEALLADEELDELADVEGIAHRPRVDRGGDRGVGGPSGQALDDG